MTLDTIALEVLWNRLLSVTNEQQVTLIRTAFSTVVREVQDLACGVFDTKGAMIAQSLTGTPGHINAMATGVRHFLKEFPEETLDPGDVLLTNDPWLTAGQVNDMTVLTPVFRKRRVVAYFASTCHAPDIGGRILSAEAHEVFEEGLRIPMTKLFAGGEPNAELLKIIRANVRTPEETVGDLYAQASSNAVGARSLIHFMEEFGLDSIDPLADEIISRSERALRDAIHPIPNGTYENEAWSDGFEEPIRIKVGRDRRGRRHPHRLRRFVAREPPRDQRRAQLHACICIIRRESRDQPGSTAQRGRLSTGARNGPPRARFSIAGSRPPWPRGISSAISCRE